MKLCLLPIPLLHPGCYIHCCREDPPSPTNPISASPQPNRAQVLPAALLLLPTGKCVYIVLEKTIESTQRACICLSSVLHAGLCNSHLKGVWHLKQCWVMAMISFLLNFTLMSPNQKMLLYYRGNYIIIITIRATTSKQLLIQKGPAVVLQHNTIIFGGYMLTFMLHLTAALSFYWSSQTCNKRFSGFRSH